MTRISFAAAAAMVIVLPNAAHAEAAEPSAYSCEFKKGESWSYDAGAFKSAASSPLTFDIEAIDLEGQTATLKATSGTGNGSLRVIRAINANHFLEAVAEGFLNLTTVYDQDATTKLYPAVHSRHFGLLGQPVFAQYSGFCRAK
jgi:hypothetical protein